MDLLKTYLERVQYVNGVYLLKLPADMTAKQAQAIAGEWQREYGMQRSLMIMPEDVSFEYIPYFDASIALRLIKSGWEVYRTSDEMHYYFKQGNRIYKKHINTGKQTEYSMSPTDLMAEDWKIYKLNEQASWHQMLRSTRPGWSGDGSVEAQFEALLEEN